MNNTPYQNLIEEASRMGCPFYRDVRLAQYTTWQVGGPADIVLEPQSVEQLVLLLALVNRGGIPFIVIGAGSNILFSDEGVRGVVLKIGSSLSRLTIQGRRITAEAGAWVPWIARKAGSCGLSGLEHVIGIPGTLGGLLVMNGGSRRESIGTTVTRVEALTHQGEKIVLSQEECRFGYRSSAFQNERLIVVQAEMELLERDPREIRREMLSILRDRRKKFPIKEASCGSVFLSEQTMFLTSGPPGKLIEAAGLKGVTLGGAQVSIRHANFIINRGQATSHDIVSLISKVRRSVKLATGVILNCEVHYVDEQCRLTNVPVGK